MDERQLQEAFDRLPGPENDGATLERILERVDRARRRRFVVRAATALVVLIAVGFGSFQAYEALRPPAQLVITDDDVTDVDGPTDLDAAGRELLADIRSLRDDWQAGRIEIDWPPAPDDTPMASLAWMSLDELFGWLENVVSSPEVTAFLRDEADPEALLAAIRSWPEVTAARFVSRDEALARLRADLQQHSGLLDDLPTNPLPDSIEIAVGTQEAARVVGERLQATPGVDEARWSADTSFSAERVLTWLKAHSDISHGSPGGPDGPVAPGIPTPIVDGGFHYYGDGRFVTDTGREFFWRNGRFENPDGSLLEVPESVNETLRSLGMPAIETQPTAGP